MGRRKKDFLSDGSDSDSSAALGSDGGYDSQEDADSKAERRLFEHRHKRPRTGQNGKDAAWEGIFGEEEAPRPRQTRGGLGARGGGKGASSSRTDWTKAPSFVPKSATAATEEAAEPTGGDTESDRNLDDSDGSSDESEDEPSRAPSPRVREDDEEDAPRNPGMGGLGFRASAAFSAAAGSTPPISQSASATPEPEKVSAFGKSAAAMRSHIDSTQRSNFQPSRSSTPKPTVKAHELSNAEKTHFNKIANDFGARMLAKHGWAPGKGLGANEDGRAVPVAVGKVMRGAGIQSGMRTEDSKREARRRGELVEDEPKPTKAKAAKAKKEAVARDSWQTKKQVKIKVEHRTYEQLVAEQPDSFRPGVGLVLDARGGELKAVESLSELSLSGWTPTSDTTKLPELRHNLRLILDVAKGDVNNLVKEGKSINERRQWSTRDEERANKKSESSIKDITRFEQLRAIIKDVSTATMEDSKRQDGFLKNLEQPFTKLTLDYPDEYKSLGLDDVVVGSIDQVLRPAFSNWDPFAISSDTLLSTLKPWRKAFNLPSPDEQPEQPSDRVMTAWESLLWHRWLPKVRSAINNEWDAYNPYPAVHLLESWESILPPFIRDNIIDQLVLPKLMSAVAVWDGRQTSGKPVSLAGFLFPWLPLLGERTNDVVEEAKRRLRSFLRRWSVADGVVDELAHWRKEMYTSREWDKLMGEHVLPKLSACLREEFVINPRKQDMRPLVEWVLPWHTFLRGSTFVRMFELEFFPKWLNVLYLWLAHPGHNGDEVASWFEMWKGVFPPALLSNPDIAHGFSTGLNLMREAMALGPEATSKLRKPDYMPTSTSRSSNGASSSRTAPASRPKLVQPDDITFKSLVEDHVASNDLLMVPTGVSHVVSGKPLLRVSKTLNKGGVTVYIGEDAVFAQDKEGVFRAIPLDELVKRAGGGAA